MKGVLRFTGRVLGKLLLVGAIIPIVLLGPSLVRAPVTLWHELAVRVPAPCLGHTPRAVKIVRMAGPHIRLVWKAPLGEHPAAYRVLRSGHTVAQTRGRSLVVAVKLRRATTFTVQARYVSAPHACAAVLRSKLALRPPGAVGALRIVRQVPGSLTLGWLKARRGDAPISGYRVLRDGAVAGQTKLTTYTLKVSGSRPHTIVVVAVDTRGQLGPASNPILLNAQQHASQPASTSHSVAAVAPPTPPRVPPGEVPPGMPESLAYSEVVDQAATVSWLPATAGSARIVGYRVYRDEELVGETPSTSLRLTNLSSNHSYSITVSTVDAAHRESARTQPLIVLTTHTPPSTPTGLSATNVTSQTVTLQWAPSTPVSGEIIGYRVFRNEVPVGQVSATQLTLSNLFPSTDYEITVAAVDSLGAISAPTAPLAVQTAEPPPTHGTAQVFLLASTDQSFEDFEQHYQQIGVVYPTYFECNASGVVTGNNDPLMTGWAQARKVEVMPRLNCQRPSVEHQILTNIPTREAFINELMSEVETYNYQGLQIDFEAAPATDRAAFTAFITELAARLHAQGRKLSTVVTAKTYNIMSGRAAMYDDAALSVPSDYIFVLDWGLHWTTSAPGAMDEMAWWRKVAEYVATMPNKSKFVIGMPMYGIDWPGAGGPSNPGTPLEYSNVMALVNEHAVLPQYDSVAQDSDFTYIGEGGVTHTVWYTDQQSIAARLEVAASLGLGVGLWHMGTEDQSIWELPGLGGSG
jgi:spore germination protein YaaH